MFSPLNILFVINTPFGINILIILVFTNALFYQINYYKILQQSRRSNPKSALYGRKHHVFKSQKHKTPSTLCKEGFVPSAGVEPARFPTGV
jgi:hypothetical protein